MNIILILIGIVLSLLIIFDFLKASFNISEKHGFKLFILFVVLFVSMLISYMFFTYYQDKELISTKDTKIDIIDSSKISGINSWIYGNDVKFECRNKNDNNTSLLGNNKTNIYLSYFNNDENDEIINKDVSYYVENYNNLYIEEKENTYKKRYFPYIDIYYTDTVTKYYLMEK